MFRFQKTRSYTAVLSLFVSVTLFAAHGAWTPSSGLYRIPYVDGLAVSANNDHHNHPNVPNRVDLGGGRGNNIVAAASGIIRAVVDFNGNGVSPGDGAGDGLGSDGLTAQNDDLEHSCLDNNTVVGNCSDYNNYVWIEHPNGEWTKYTHFATGSVTANLWQVGDTVLVGQILGQESDIGSASGSHLHFEVAIPTNPNDTTPFSTLGGFIQGSNVVTQVCSSAGFDAGDGDGDGMYTDGENYTAGPCTNTQPTADAGGPYVTNEGSDIQLDGSGSSDPENAILNYLWSPNTNLDDDDIVDPTYSALDDSFENIDLTVNDAGGDVSGGSVMQDTDSTTVTVNNVAPTVSAVGDLINEGSDATVSATFTDPGTLDTHTATIDWGDGSGLEVVDPATLLNSGIEHEYCDNGNFNVTVTVTDKDSDSGDDLVGVTVVNVDPEVTTVGDTIDEGQTATVTATFTDPGCDTHTASIDWGDGSPLQPVNNPAVTLAAGVQHIYGDNGGYTVKVTVTDDDGGSDMDLDGVTVNNLDPSLTLDTDDQISFPGGDYYVVGINENLALSASGSDAGSDDLIFDWSTGDMNTYFNDGNAADPPMSPFGTFPFEVLDDTINGNFPMPGVESLLLTLSDDDGGSDVASEEIIVTGDANKTRGQGWWKHQFSGDGTPHIDEDVAQGYVDIVNAVSSIFSEEVSCQDAAEAHGVLSPSPSNTRARAEAALLLAWLQFASGAVAVDSTVPQGGKSTVDFLPLMFDAEAIIANGSSSKKELRDIEKRLKKVKQASS